MGQALGWGGEGVVDKGNAGPPEQGSGVRSGQAAPRAGILDLCD